MKDLHYQLRRIRNGMGSMAMENWGEKEEAVIDEALERLVGNRPEIEIAKEALRQILFLNSCEEEGLQSGRPPAEAWRDAFEQCAVALDALEKAPSVF